MNIIMKNNTKLWLENPMVFILDAGFLNFIPTREMNKTEQINACTLFLLYILIFTHLFKINHKYVNIVAICLIVFMVIIYYGYYNKVEKMDNETIEDKDIDISISSGYYDSDNTLKLGKFYSHRKNKSASMERSYEEMQKYLKATERKPTPDNPFMNPLVSDFNTENIPSPSNADDEDIQNEISNAFNKDLFRDLNDLYDRKNSQRTFYTVPGGSVPNDQDAFAKWCYALPETCNESGTGCLRKFDEDLRYRTGYK
jgi:hypothetical protein